MAYNPSGDVDISFNFNVERDGPIDARTTVTEKTYLTDIDLPYPGMIVSVTNSTTASDNGVYILDNGDGSNLNHWTKITTGGSGITSLTTDTTGYLDIDTTVGGTPEIPKLTINADSGSTPSADGIVARDSSGFAYVETAPGASNDKTIATTAFVKSTIASAITLIDGFNASDGALDSTGNLYTDTTELVVGNYYIATTAGNFFTQTPAVNLNPGDYVVVQTAVSAGVTRTEDDFIVVTQTSGVANIDDIGLGNVNALDVDPSGGGGAYDAGLSVSYDTGTAVINNTDKGSAQNIFKTITINSIPADNFTATSNSTQLNIRQGTGISITKNSAGALEIASTVSAGGMNSFDYSGDDGDILTITNGNRVQLAGGNLISTEGIVDSTSRRVVINHDEITTTPSSISDTITSGGTFDSITSVTTNSSGHLTDVETTTFTMPTLITGGGVDNRLAVWDGAGNPATDLTDAPIVVGNNTVEFVGQDIQLTPNTTNPSNIIGNKITVDGNIDIAKVTQLSSGSIDGYIEYGGGAGASAYGFKLNSFGQALITAENSILYINPTNGITKLSSKTTIVDSDTPLALFQIGANSTDSSLNAALRIGQSQTGGTGFFYDFPKEIGTADQVLGINTSGDNQLEWVDRVKGTTAGSPNTAVTEIRTLTQAQYDNLVIAGTVQADVMYVIINTVEPT
jgi:hypothetical protein